MPSNACRYPSRRRPRRCGLGPPVPPWPDNSPRRPVRAPARPRAAASPRASRRRRERARRPRGSSRADATSRSVAVRVGRRLLPPRARAGPSRRWKGFPGRSHRPPESRAACPPAPGPPPTLTSRLHGAQRPGPGRSSAGSRPRGRARKRLEVSPRSGRAGSPRAPTSRPLETAPRRCLQACSQRCAEEAKRHHERVVGGLAVRGEDPLADRLRGAGRVERIRK